MCIRDRYYLGRVHENAKDWHLAMDAYQKALEQGEKVKGRTDLKNQLIETTGRLRGRLGQVIVKSLVNGRCQSKVYWMIPACLLYTSGGQPTHRRAIPNAGPRGRRR